MTPPKPAPQATGRVVLIRGLFNVFSLGMDELAQRLNRDGYDAAVIPGNRRRATGKALIREAERGELKRPLIFVGHSLGGDGVVRLARQLDDAGIRVDKLVVIDAPTPGVVPDNVAEVFNVYLASSSPTLRGVPVKAESDATLVVNLNLRDDDDPRVKHGVNHGVNHFNIDTSEAVQEIVLREVMELLVGAGGGGEPDDV